MNDRIGATLRMLIPAFAVAGVLALSFLAPPQLLGSTSGVGYGYGYANNCGVKGDGFHDHGKVCPNRPFPGKGKGVMEKILGIVNKTSTETGENATGSGPEAATTSGGSAAASTALTTETDQDTQSSGHGHGKGRGHGKGHSTG